MRKTILTLAATLCAALATGTSATAQTVSVSKLQSESSRTVRGEECNMDNVVSISIEVDVPTADVASKSPKLYNAIVGWMAGTARFSIAALKSKAALDGAVKSRCNANPEPYEEVVRISKVYEDAQYVSFSLWHYRMACENAHGLATDAGVTFRKSDGQRLTWANFRKTDALRKDVTRNLRKDDEGVEVSVNVTTDEMEHYDECRLSDGTYALPLPETAPYLTRRGWCFTYQPYETIMYGMDSMWSYVSNVSLTN